MAEVAVPKLESPQERKVDAASRLTSLDLFRGLTIASMVMVNNPGNFSTTYGQLLHAEWHGWTFTDLVFPFFLWIVGVAMTLSTARRLERGEERSGLLAHVIRRAALIFLIGLLLNGFPRYAFATLRIPGVLQRIAVCYLIAGIIYLYTSWRGRIYWLLGFLASYTLLMHPGGYEKGTNLAAQLDAWLLTGHMYGATKTWDPEGILSTLPAIGTCLFGILTGDFLRTTLRRAEKTAWMLVAGNVLIFLGKVIDIWQPINKMIWTCSYSIFTAGMALVVFGICYWLVDVNHYRKGWTRPLVIFGMNALAVYIFSGVLARLVGLWKVSDVSVKRATYDSLAAALNPYHASLTYALLNVAVCFLFAWILYRRQWFLKL